MMLDSIQQKLQSLEDNIAASKHTNAELASKLRRLQVRTAALACAICRPRRHCRAQEEKAHLVASMDTATIACEELDKSIKEEATQVSALEWEQRAHKNAVKLRKQKVVSLRGLDAKDLAQTTAERKEVSVSEPCVRAADA
jgi:hypothetical protein